MTFGDRIRAFFGRLGKKAMILIPSWMRGQPQYSPISIITFINQYYRKDDVVYACIKEIARTASEAQLKVYKKDEEDQLEQQPNHPLQELLDRPNPKMSQYEIHEGILTDLNISGEAFIYLEPSAARRVVALWRLRPERITVVPGDMGEVIAYEYGTGDSMQIFPSEDVIHIPFFNPVDDYRGLSPMEVASRLLDINTDLTDYIKKFFEQGAMIPGYLKYLAGTLTKAEKRRGRKEFSEMFGGADEWFAPPLLDIDLDFVKTGLDYKEMEFANLRAYVEVAICRVFGVPPILLPTQAGLDASTYSNYEAAEKSFWQDTLSPLYRRIQDKWQMGLVPRFGNNLIVEFDFSKVKALQEDKLEPRKVAVTAFQAGGITRNQLLEAFGHDPVEGGNVFLQDMMKLEIPAEGAPKGWRITKPEQKQLTNGHLKAIPRDTYPEEKAERWHVALNTVARAYEGPFKAKARELFAEEAKEILKILRKEGKQAKQGVPYQQFLFGVQSYLGMADDKWREEFLPIFRALLEVQGENISAAFGMEFDITREETIQFLQGYTMEFAEGIVSTTGEKVSDIIIKGQKEGWSVPDMRKALTEKFDEFDTVRATRIARTETIRSSNAGAVEAYRQANLDKTEWYASIDGRQCAECEALHQMVIAIGGTWDGHDYPPAHPNCRCTVLPVIEEV